VVATLWLQSRKWAQLTHELICCQGVRAGVSKERCGSAVGVTKVLVGISSENTFDSGSERENEARERERERGARAPLQRRLVMAEMSCEIQQIALSLLCQSSPIAANVCGKKTTRAAMARRLELGMDQSGSLRAACVRMWRVIARWLTPDSVTSAQACCKCLSQGGWPQQLRSACCWEQGAC